MPSSRSQAWLCVVLYSLASASALQIEFDHSFDGHNFVAGGTLSIEADSEGDATQAALLQRTHTSLHGLEALFEIDGVYKIRVPSNLNHPEGSPFATASIPVRCWAEQGFKTPIVLQMATSSSIAGISFGMFCDQGPGTNHRAAEQLWAKVRGSAIPQSQYVRVQHSAEAAKIDMLRLGMFGGESAAAQPVMNVQLPVDAAKSVAGSGENEAGSGKGKEGKEGKTPAKDDRTWIQKNWMFVVPVAMAVMNLLGNSLAGTADRARQREAARQGVAVGGAGPTPWLFPVGDDVAR